MSDAFSRTAQSGVTVVSARVLCGSVLGSSLVVYPAAGFPRLAKRNGARLVIINREATDQDDSADLVIHHDIGPTIGAAVGVD